MIAMPLLVKPFLSAKCEGGCYCPLSCRRSHGPSAVDLGYEPRHPGSRDYFSLSQYYGLDPSQVPLFSSYLFSPRSGLPAPDTAPALSLSFATRQLPGVETLSPTRSLHMTSMQLVFTQARLEGNVCAPWLSLSTCDLKSSHQRTQDLDAHVTFGVSWLCDLG